VIWAAIIGTLGYYFGRAVESVLGRAEHIERIGLIALLLIAGAVWAYHQWTGRREEAGDSAND
jgi:membrane protein DedA with SNARE-associated domain